MRKRSSEIPGRVTVDLRPTFVEILRGETQRPILKLHGLRGEGLGQFGVEVLRGKPEGLGLFIGVGVIDLADAGQVHGGQTHGARMPAGVHDMAIEPGVLLRPSGRANRLEFGMSRRIVARQHRVHTGGDDLSVLEQHRAERAAFPRPHILQGQLDGQGEVIVRC